MNANTFLNGSGSDQVPKLLGADVELGNLVLGLDRREGTGAEASHLLLRHVAGFPLQSDYITLGSTPSPSGTVSAHFNAQDWGRKYQASNGGCVYIDLNHLELCPPETLNAFDHAAAFHAMLQVAREGLQKANARLIDGLRIVAVVNNSDGLGHSYGGHMNCLISRKAWDSLFNRRLHYLLYLASYQVSSIIFTGQGKVGSEDGAPPVPFQLSQRADFFRCLTGVQTTFDRPIINSRDEALCGHWRAEDRAADRLARFHCIFYDSTLCPGSIVLRAGIMQIMLSLIEADQVGGDLILEDPLETVIQWSHDPSMHTRARLVSGREVTPVELQRMFLEQASRFVDQGGCEGVVPRAREILELWADTLDKLKAGDVAALASRLDWALKLSLIQRVLEQNPHLDWSSPEIKHLDFKYADLGEGLYWACERAGAIEPCGVSAGRIQQLTQEPPEDTRAWTRAHLLRRAEPDAIDTVDWDSITFRLRDEDGWPKRRTVNLSNPLRLTQRETEAVFDRSDSLEEVLDLLGAPERDSPSSSGTVEAGSQSWFNASRSTLYLSCGGETEGDSTTGLDSGERT